MSNLKAVEKKWIENFSKSPLVDRAIEAVNPQFAFEFFYGKSEESRCPEEFLFDFNSHYNNRAALDVASMLEKCCEYLGFIGVQLSIEKVKEFLKNRPRCWKNAANILDSMAYSKATKRKKKTTKTTLPNTKT